MLVNICQNSTWEELHPLLAYCQHNNVDVQETFGQTRRVLLLLGDTAKLDADRILAFPAVMGVTRLQSPYRLAGRELHPEDSAFQIKGAAIGKGDFLMIAGPCSVESEDQIIETAKLVKAAGASMLRGGAYKPRSSPYAFQGLQEEGLRLLIKAAKETNLPVVSEIMETAQLPLFDEIDVIQVGTRNMQNYELLKELSRVKKPILLKRGLSSRLDELLLSAEYLMSGGNEQVILCERGIRTFDSYARNTLDIGAVPALKTLSHLPVIVDPSHGTGRRTLIAPMALAATAAGADGLMIEVHTSPENALCDGHQALTPDVYTALCKKVRAVRAAIEG